MKLLALALLLAANGPYPLTIGPYGEVPEPVPEGYEYCIAALILSPEDREKFGLMRFFYPPIDAAGARNLNYFVQRGRVKLSHCNQEKT